MADSCPWLVDLVDDTRMEIRLHIDVPSAVMLALTCRAEYAKRTLVMRRGTTFITHAVRHGYKRLVEWALYDAHWPSMKDPNNALVWELTMSVARAFGDLALLVAPLVPLARIMHVTETHPIDAIRRFALLEALASGDHVAALQTLAPATLPMGRAAPWLLSAAQHDACNVLAWATTTYPIITDTDYIRHLASDAGPGALAWLMQWQPNVVRPLLENCFCVNVHNMTHVMEQPSNRSARIVAWIAEHVPPPDARQATYRLRAMCQCTRFRTKTDQRILPAIATALVHIHGASAPVGHWHTVDSSCEWVDWMEKEGVYIPPAIELQLVTRVGAHYNFLSHVIADNDRVSINVLRQAYPRMATHLYRTIVSEDFFIIQRLEWLWDVCNTVEERAQIASEIQARGTTLYRNWLVSLHSLAAHRWWDVTGGSV